PLSHSFFLRFSKGSLTLCITNPIWVVKTRLCLQYERLAQIAERSVASSKIGDTGRLYRTIPRSETTWSTLVNLWRFEGLRGLYRGFLPGLFGVSHGAIQFMLYEEMRNAYNQRYRDRPVNAKLTALEYLTFASVSKLAAALLTYPYQVVRSRLQDQHRHYRGLVHVVRELWIFEGFLGFYKGIVPNLLRVVPACAITFVIYEYMVDLLHSKVVL
ncbi:Mitochondrial folate transporter/carrier, partial [Fasciolopsis buskii]